MEATLQSVENKSSLHKYFVSRNLKFKTKKTFILKVKTV